MYFLSFFFSQNVLLESRQSNHIEFLYGIGLKISCFTLSEIRCLCSQYPNDRSPWHSYIDIAFSISDIVTEVCEMDFLLQGLHF